MKTYKTLFWYTIYGSSLVEAESKKEAEKKLYKMLDEEGIEFLSFDCHDRDFNTQEAEEIETIEVGDEEHNVTAIIEDQCTLSLDCLCDECREETEFDNGGGADRW